MSSPTTASEPLLPRVAAGEPGAVEHCIDRYGSLVWTIARRMLAKTADAEDAVQEVFLEIWRQAPRFDPNLASEATFITMLARRRVIDQLRRGAKQPDSELPEELIDARAPSSDAGLLLAEQAKRVRETLQKISPDQRQVIELAICHGRTQTAIAQQMGVPLGTVKSHARRGLQRLRELLTPARETDGGGAA